jgi:hypothetical protein
MTMTFTSLGTLSCPAPAGQQPFSMGVDRNTIAWVLYSDGTSASEIFRVDINNNLACTPTSWAAQGGMAEFGMGFSTDSAGGTTDTLFIGGGPINASGVLPSTSTLATLNMTSLGTSTVGTINGWPELTGTATAQLWGFLPDTSPPTLVQLDKTNGKVLNSFPESTLAGTPVAWAFAFWGGDYWVFLQRALQVQSWVYQVDGMTGAIKSMTKAGMAVVGAGVSTCAPITIQ